jgi:organic radical activating enzyme
MKYLMFISLLFAFNVKADTSSDDLTLADEAIQSPSMDIEGQYQVKEEVKAAPVVVKEAPVAVVAPKKVAKRLSQSDRMKMYRERLEERNRIMIEKKMEQIRFQQELALARKLEQSMNQTLKAIDTVK